ncbi:MAG: FumA C-terminus/TtdB family hydratase beta subunit [Oscillospiraceae bacterium]|nr:FumA C-terminus/TtdB family hydratase beta subunit [Oscillospiraceae bacterium]
MAKKLTLPLTKTDIATLRAGESVLLSGEILLARDAAHKRLCDMLERGETLPVDLENATIYYCGPTATPPDRVIGSAGPTTSSRMDAYAPMLIRLGMTAMIGKGPRAAAVVDAMVECGCVYFAALGGAGALLASAFVSVEVAAFPDLGTEAVRRAVVRDFPAIVAIDAAGGNAYDVTIDNGQ